MDAIKKAFYLALVIAIIDGGIFGVFYLFKSSNKVTIPATDQSMVPEYEYGNKLLSPVRSAADLKVGQAVAYYVPGKPDVIRVAWVIALEGQAVSLENNAWKVDGAAAVKQIIPRHEGFKDAVVPSGCAWLLAYLPEDDSSKHGPIPVRCILGRLPPPN